MVAVEERQLVDPARMDDAAYREDMRHRCMTDHLFLAELMGFHEFHSVIHKPVVDFYFPKNPNLTIPEQHKKKNRLHLDPRGTFKTTFSRVDSLQWILAFPKEITILNQSATQPLAKAISEGVANYFCRYKIITPIQKLFPELVVDKWPFHSDDEWRTPNHDLRDIDPTIAFTSPYAQQSGPHPWVEKCDDLVDTRNSGIHANPTARRGVIDTFDTNKKALRRGGYMYLPGTRYHPFELYGVKLQDMDPDEWDWLIRGAVTVKSGARLMVGEFPPEDEVICNFKELPGMGYKQMRKEFYDNYEVFMCQLQNDPQGGSVQIFPEVLWNSSQIAMERVPPYGGEVFICWRLACSSKKNMSRTEGAAARIVDGKVVIIECWQGGWNPTRTAERMVLAQKMHSANGMMIMLTPGSEFMEHTIRNEALRKNVSLKMQWVDWEDSADRREMEVKQLEPMMKVGRLQFAAGMTKGAELRKQVVHFGLIEESGMIECVSKLANLVSMSQMRAHMEDSELEWHRRRNDDALVSNFMQRHGIPVVDEMSKQRVVAHQRAVQRATTRSPLPPMPGGLDG